MERRCARQRDGEAACAMARRREGMCDGETTTCRGRPRDGALASRRVGVTARRNEYNLFKTRFS